MAIEILADVQKVFGDTRLDFDGEALKLKQEGYCKNVGGSEILEKVIRLDTGEYVFSPYEPDFVASSSSSSVDGNMAGFTGTSGDIIRDLGFAIQKNTDFGLLTFTDDDDCELKLTYDDIIPFYNDTGVLIKAGTVLHLKGGALVGSQVMATFELADASDWEKIQGTNGQATCDVAIGATGKVARKGQFKHIDTAHTAAGLQNWISATVAGAFTNTKPSFPDYAISLGGTAISDVDGEILVNITGDVNDTFHDSWDGAIRESFNFTISATGGVITGLLENVDPLRNLTLIVSDLGFYTLDTTTAPLTIVLPEGTDEVVLTSYVYIPIETKVLTISNVAFPVTEHCRIAVVDCQSATNIEAKGGARGNQNLNDHIKKESNNGHILHIADWIRSQFASIKKKNGCDVSLDSAAGNGYLTMTSGSVLQLHPHAVDAIVMPTADIMVANDPDIAFSETSNLNTITKYSNGTSWNNKWGKIVVWAIANKTGEPDFLLINLPSAGYNNSSDALNDILKYANYSMPEEYTSKAVLLREFAINVNNGTLTYSGDNQDLRGTFPSNIAGEGGGGSGAVTSVNGQTGAVVVDLNDVLVADGDGGGGSITNLALLEVENTGADSSAMMKSSSQDVISIIQSAQGNNRFFAYPIAGLEILTNTNHPIAIGTNQQGAGVPAVVVETNGVVYLTASAQEIEAASLEAAVNKEYLGELRFTVPPLGTVNVTSENTGAVDNSFTATFGILQSINVESLSFGTNSLRDIRHTPAVTDVSSALIAWNGSVGGWSFTNTNPTTGAVATIKSIGESPISELTAIEV
jgi:hypothetical protein